MQKYIMLTRGRTGSTAVLDEIASIEGVFSVQELFLRCPADHIREDLFRDYYRHILPFDVWKWNAKIRRLISLAIERFQFVPAGAYLARFLAGRFYNAYLKYVENAASERGETRLIFKVLSNNLTERAGLAEILKRRGYRVLYLVRSNLARQVISGQIAKLRGVYNRKNYAGDKSAYTIDLDEFEMLVKVEKMRVDEGRELLRAMSFDYLEISYEEFCNNRDRFYSGILKFMGLPPGLPKKTDFSIMTDDLRNSIVNYDELEKKVMTMGLERSLSEPRQRGSAKVES